MGTRGLKICRACRRSFEPQLTDDEIFDLWFTEEEIEADEEHEAMTGHSHLRAPVQELCAKCAMDPELYPVYGPFGGPPQYRRKGKTKRLPVQDGNVMQLPRHPGHLLQDMIDSAPKLDVHKVKASDGTEMEIHGPQPPPEVVEEMARIYKTMQPDEQKKIQAAVAKAKQQPKLRVRITRKKKKPTLWQMLIGKKRRKK